MPAHIRKGDIVYVRSGDDRGKTGEVISVNPEAGTCIVKGVNVHTKHLKPSQQRPKGALVKMELPVNISKVSPVADGKPTRVRFTVKPDGSKVRVAVKSGKELGAVSPAKKSAKAK
ncbi:MAG: 50S ribosomal protein L24 [Phycisphaerales bacterium]